MFLAFIQTKEKTKMIINQLRERVTLAFHKAGFDSIEPKLILSNRPDLCDYQSDSCFTLAKLMHTNPWNVAEKVLEELLELEKEQPLFQKIEIARPGFLNFTLSDAFLTQAITVMGKEEKFGLALTKNAKKFVLDYGGPNVAKPLHVGHLRTAILGESVKRILRWYGHEVISDVHLGDYGLQIGQVIYGAKQDGIKPEELTLAYLDEIYPKMSALSKTDERVKELSAEITKELQEGNEDYQTYFREIVRISVEDIRRIYEYLDVHFEYWMGESDSYKDIPALEKLLNEKGLLYTSQGARVMDIKKEGDKVDMPPLLFQKSNGAYLYATTDMATVYQRVRDFDPDYILYFTDLRQGQHFESFFRACKIAQIVKEDKPKLEFCGYGTVNGLDGKPFKTRSGDSPKLDGLFNQVRDAFIKTKESNKNATQEDINRIVNAIIKFADLQNAKERDYIFDIEKFSSIVGKTGPYILYTYLRLKNIVDSNLDSNFVESGSIYNDIDRKLRLELLKYFTMFPSAVEGRSPSIICDYVYNLCMVANTFYESNRISSLENKTQKQDWCHLLNVVVKVLKQMFELILIEPPSIM